MKLSVVAAHGAESNLGGIIIDHVREDRDAALSVGVKNHDKVAGLRAAARPGGPTRVAERQDQLLGLRTAKATEGQSDIGEVSGSPHQLRTKLEGRLGDLVHLATNPAAIKTKMR